MLNNSSFSFYLHWYIFLGKFENDPELVASFDAQRLMSLLLQFASKLHCGLNEARKFRSNLKRETQQEYSVWSNQTIFYCFLFTWQNWRIEETIGQVKFWRCRGCILTSREISLKRRITSANEGWRKWTFLDTQIISGSKALLFVVIYKACKLASVNTIVYL